MDSKQFYRDRLPEHLDGIGDLAPPWERFPNYERYTIGWRMGAGEDWLCLWDVFLDGLGPEPETRLAYLRRHPPAPVSWADAVHRVLHPGSEDEDDEDDEAEEEDRRAAYVRDGLIASDAAYPIWLSQQHGVRWPWEFAETPVVAARYWTRDLWFWSRQIAEGRGTPHWAVPAVPEPWLPCAVPLATGAAGTLDLRQGLLSLARLLSAGHVEPPWRLGLTFADFADTFDDDMGYVDAFRLWGMSAFDDREHLQRHLAGTGTPDEWARWAAEQFMVR